MEKGYDEESVKDVDSDTELLQDISFVSVYGGKDKKDAITNNKKLCEGIIKGDVPSLSVFNRDTVYENDWTNLSVSIIETWLRACTVRAQYHLEESCIFKKKSTHIKIPEMLTSGGATAMAFWAAGTGEATSTTIRLIVAALSCTATILKGLESFIYFYGLENRHHTASNDYSRLCRKIEVNIFTPNHLKPNIQAFMEEVSLTYSHILSTSPPINVLQSR